MTSETSVDIAVDFLKSIGYPDKLIRVLPDGRIGYVHRFLYTAAVALVSDPTTVTTGYDDRWCYENVTEALHALTEWNPATEKEPIGWHRHHKTGRRRPDGDPTKEYINY